MASTSTSSGSRSSSRTSSASASSSFVQIPTFSSFTNPIPSESFNGSRPGPPSNNGPQNDGPNVATSANLYLYTFLATLILLLTVSGAIVFRSCILRRRHRAMVEEAIRNGTYIPPPSFARNRIDPNKKPKLYEAHLAVEPPDDWESMKPFSGKYVSVSPNTTPISAASSRTNVSSIAPRPTFMSRFITQGQRMRRRPSPPPDASEKAAGKEKEDSLAGPSVSEVQMSVMIAMPSPTAFPSDANRNDEPELPLLEFGIAKMVVVSDEADEIVEGDGGDERVGGDAFGVGNVNGNSTTTIPR